MRCPLLLSVLHQTVSREGYLHQTVSAQDIFVLPFSYIFPLTVGFLDDIL